MLFSFDSYPVNDIKIPLGTSFQEASKLLNEYSQFKPYGGWKNIRCECKQILGLKATEAEIRAPLENRPVMQVNYQLSPLATHSEENLHEIYLDELIKHLGLPVKTTEDYPKDFHNYPYKSGKVVYSAKWLMGDIRVGLAVYGGTRNNESGDSAAGLFMDWINEKNAAQPYLDSVDKWNAKVSKIIKDSPEFEKFIFDNEHRKFLIRHFDIGSIDVNKDEELRVAQMALYKTDLFPTPTNLSEQLNEKEIALKFTEDGMIILANKWDCTFIKPNEDTILYTDIQPARGSGIFMLDAKHLSMCCARDSNAINHIVETIEKKTARKVTKTVGYDD